MTHDSRLKSQEEEAGGGGGGFEFRRADIWIYQVLNHEKKLFIYTMTWYIVHSTCVVDSLVLIYTLKLRESAYNVYVYI